MILHYFKEGELNYSYLDTWHKYAGQMEFKHWNKNNLPYENYPFLNKLVQEGKWSIISDFIRRWAIIEYGGIYLDFDVELIKPIDFLHDFDSFVCIEGEPIYANMAVSGGKKNNKHHKKLLEMYFDVLNGKLNYPSKMEVACGTLITTDYIQTLKGSSISAENLSEIKNYDGFTTLPKQCFFPFNWNESYSDNCVKNDTYGIHWWAKGW
jgi:mannosyltransferase OCH1-like enzyme